MPSHYTITLKTTAVMTKIKVCGMRSRANIREILALEPDFMGFIFHEKSPRHVGEELDEELLKSFPNTTKKVGVFVNAHPDLILRNVKKYGFDLVQLHGDELPDVCRNIRNRGVSVIKAFAMDNQFNFSRLNNYKPHCDYFLFDTKGAAYGGNGTAFDWKILNNYDGEKPFFLSGGVGLDNLEDTILLAKQGLNLYGVDINSRVETEPGVKDALKVQEFMRKLKPVLQDS